MFDVPMRSDLSAVPVPLPGRVIIFVDGSGALRARLPDGSVSALEAGPPGLTGAAGDVYGDRTGQKMFLLPTGNITALAIGDVVISNGANLMYGDQYPWVSKYRVGNEIWKFIACGQGQTVTRMYLFLRVA